ncbi:MAG TPA: hypothetical protein VGG64_12890, partial [Pirellulales bacterium]
MARKRLLWQLYPSYLLVAVTAIVSVGWFAAYLLEKSHLAALDERLHLTAQLVLQEIGESLSPDDAEPLGAVCARIAADTGTNVSVKLASGRVLAESGNREEATTAGAPPQQSAAMTSGADGREMFVALPIVRGGNELGVVRSSIPLSAIRHTVRKSQFGLAGAGLLIAGCAAVLCLVVSRQVSRPFEEIRDVAERFAR